MTQRQASFSVAVFVALVILNASANDAQAQAWVGGQGSLDLALDYNLGKSTKVIGDGATFADAGSTTHQLTVGAEYVPIPKLAVTVAVPVVFLKYDGNQTAYEHEGGGRYDDGDLHGTLTDVRGGVRYQLLEEPFALSPHLAVSIPVADYETVGNTVAGRHLKALHAGLGAGYVIGNATYVHLMYEFSLVEKYDRTPDTAKHSQNRSDLAFTIGHKLLDHRLDLHADANMRKAHGGVSLRAQSTLTDDEELYHDAILKEDIVLVGGGIGYQVSNSFSLSLSARFFLTGTNTQNASVVALGAAWSPLL
ncbi:MAG: hypothetical protein M3680_09335 [Myxococcota bacterium]|nr:hypothetical protein [Myxococcota bacterium]